jgi:L-ascorbate metabolism protein UlaG (beta-lactamase superfamily)
MDLQYHGGNCVSIAAKGMRLVFDDNLAELGLKTVSKPNDVVLFTMPHGSAQVGSRLTIDGPGEYEVSGLSIVGIPARGHMDSEKTEQATIYKVTAEDVNYLVLGHIYPNLSDRQLETIGMVDVLVIPVGGNGYTLDPVGALQLIKKIEPKIVVPTHYADNQIHYPVEQQTLEQALKTMAMEPKETVAKLHFKAGELLTTQLVVVTRS